MSEKMPSCFPVLPKEDRQLIEKLNTVLRTKYRTKPYDFANVNDLNVNDLMEALSLITGWYLDVRHYWAVLDLLKEQFDESLEIVFPDERHHVRAAEGSSEETIKNAFKDLRTATNSFYSLIDEAKEICKGLWTLVLTKGSEEMLARLGLERPSPLEVMLLLDFGSVLDFMETDAWQYNMEYAFQAFATGIKNYLAYIRKGATK